MIVKQLLIGAKVPTRYRFGSGNVYVSYESIDTTIDARMHSSAPL